MQYLGHATAAAKSLQLCPTLCDPRDGSPPGSPIPGIFQARTLEWVAIAFSNAWKWKVKVKSLSRVRLLATPWTAAHQAPPSMGFSRQEYWSGCHCLHLYLKNDPLHIWNSNSTQWCTSPFEKSGNPLHKPRSKWGSRGGAGLVRLSDPYTWPKSRCLLAGPQILLGKPTDGS